MHSRTSGREPGGLRFSRALLAGALLLAGQAACRSAGGPPPTAPPGPLTDAARALVGQQRILRFHGREKSVSLKMQDLAGQSGPCDVAVEVKTAALTGGSARFTLELTGRPRLEGQPRERRGRKSPCRELPVTTSLLVSGLSTGSPEKLIADVGKVLLTPEDYLRAHGVPFDRPPVGDPKEVADASLTAPVDEQKRASAITAPQRRLLAIDPEYRSANRKVHYEGQVEFVAVLGPDGRLHQPRLTTPLGEHEARAARVLPLWRYEPARRGEQPVAVRLQDSMILRIY